MSPLIPPPTIPIIAGNYILSGRGGTAFCVTIRIPHAFIPYERPDHRFWKSPGAVRWRLAGVCFRIDPGLMSGPNFDALFDEVFPSLHRYCHRLIGDRDAAEDVAQEAFARFLKSEMEGPPKAVRVWLFKVATHLIRDRFRTVENRRRLLEQHPVTPSTSSDPEREMERRETIRSVRAALSIMPERDRRILLMREEGFSYQEIAEAVGVKENSIGTLLARARSRFIEEYERGPAGNGDTGEDR